MFAMVEIVVPDRLMMRRGFWGSDTGRVRHSAVDVFFPELKRCLLADGRGNSCCTTDCFWVIFFSNGC